MFQNLLKYAKHFRVNCLKHKQTMTNEYKTILSESTFYESQQYPNIFKVMTYLYEYV